MLNLTYSYRIDPGLDQEAQIWTLIGILITAVGGFLVAVGRFVVTPIG